MRNQTIKKVVNCKQYNCDVFFSTKRFYEKFGEDAEAKDIKEGKDLPFDCEQGMSFCKYPMEWHNSNRLLTVPGFSGIKTGITQTAGSCLSVYYDNGEQGTKKVQLITVVLGSRNIEYRWKDTRRLTLWAAECIKHNKSCKYGEFKQEKPNYDKQQVTASAHKDTNSAPFK